MRLNFTIGTNSWIIGRALADLHPEAEYMEHSAGQTLVVERLKVERKQLDEAVSKVKVIAGTKETEGERATMIELFDAPAGDLLKFTDESWKEFEGWLKQHGQVVQETAGCIEIEDGGNRREPQ